MSVTTTNLGYALEHKNEFNRLEGQAKAKGYECEPEFRHLYLKNDDALLDAGCGSGVISRFLAWQNPHATIVGCDASRDRILQAAAAAQGIRNLSFAYSDLSSLHFESNSFDVIVCRYVFHHLSLEKRTSAIRELFRCLKPGGRIVSADPDGMFHTLRPMPDVVSHVLSVVAAKGSVDLFAGSKIPGLYLEAGFEAPKYRVELIAEDTQALSQEKMLMEQRFEQLMPFLANELDDAELAARFRDTFLAALASEGTVYYCPKVITTAMKPVHS